MLSLTKLSGSAHAVVVRLFTIHMRGSRKYCQRGSNSDKEFFEWSEAPSTQSGQLSACQRNAIEMTFRWRADNGPH